MTTDKTSRGSWLVATFFGVGYLRPGPGTYASAITVLCWWGASHLVAQRWLIPVEIISAAIITLLGIPPSTVVARESGNNDPGFVVIDEVAGQMIALIAVPLNWNYDGRCGSRNLCADPASDLVACNGVMNPYSHGYFRSITGQEEC